MTNGGEAQTTHEVKRKGIAAGNNTTNAVGIRIHKI
jgi:hypothetical protein